MIDNIQNLTISHIAILIHRDWKNVNFAAVPYLEAMSSLSSINENYSYDSGKNIVAYFLSNAAGWRGEVAKEVKKELNRRLKG